MSALQENHSTINSLGFQLIGISPDKYTFAEKMASNKNFDFQLYSDPKAELIEAFGLGWKIEETKIEKYKSSKNEALKSLGESQHATLPNPAIYIIKEGKVVFQHVNPNYAERLSEETLIAILSTLQ